MISTPYERGCAALNVLPGTGFHAPSQSGDKRLDRGAVELHMSANQIPDLALTGKSKEKT